MSANPAPEDLTRAVVAVRESIKTKAPLDLKGCETVGRLRGA
jgi:hypothetical protein